MKTATALVQACIDLVAKDGVANLSLRKVAERAGIKAPSIYEHFANKDALLAAARGQACTCLRDTLLAHSTGKTPHERLVNMGMGYLYFAEQYPALFSLMFMEFSAEHEGLHAPFGEDDPYVVLRSAVADFLSDDGPIADAMSFGVWSLVHGAAVLRHTHLQGFAAPLDMFTTQHLNALLDGWAEQTKAAVRRSRAKA